MISQGRATGFAAIDRTTTSEELTGFSPNGLKPVRSTLGLFMLNPRDLDNPGFSFTSENRQTSLIARY